MPQSPDPPSTARIRSVLALMLLFGLVGLGAFKFYRWTRSRAVAPQNEGNPPSTPSSVLDQPSSSEAGIPAESKRFDAASIDPAEEVLRWNNLGIAAMEQFDFAKAAGYFRNAREKDRQFLAATVNLGIAQFYDRKTEPAVETLRDALTRDAKQVQARFVLALALRGSGQREAALKNFLLVLGQDPSDPAALYFAGSLESTLHNQEAATRHFVKALSLDPFNQSIYYGLARACFEKGDSGGGEKAMARFQALRASGNGTSFGNLYFEQGRYAEAVRVSSYKDETYSGTIRFVDVTRPAGIDFKHAGPRRPAGSPFPPNPIEAGPARETEVLTSYGSGAAFLDYDDDGRPDLFTVNTAATGPAKSVLYRNRGDGAFARAIDCGIEFNGMGMGVAAGDYDNDGRPDLFISGYKRSALYHNEGGGKFREMTSILSTHVFESFWGLTAAFVDLDHDGDLDLYLTGLNRAQEERSRDTTGNMAILGRNLLFRNNGNGTFTEVGALSGTARTGWAPSFVLMDFDSSRDIDLLLLNSPWKLFSNHRDGSFVDRTTKAELRFESPVLGAAAGDFDGDGNIDLCAPVSGTTGTVRLLWNSGRGFVAEDVACPGRGPFWNASAFDYDNDGDLDLLLSGDRLCLLENRGRRQFVDVSGQAGLNSLDAFNTRSIVPADYDRDGDIDLFVTRGGLAPLLLRNEGRNRNRSLPVELTGKSDNRSGIGCRVDWASAGLWQRRELTGNLGFLTQSCDRLLLGLGRHSAPDYLRILWPTGVLQTELAPRGGGPVKVVELDRKGTSCPILYAWNGSEYGFVTDFLGGSALGYLLAPGKYAVPDSNETVKIRHDQLQPRDGRLSLQMVNQLEEVIFFDTVQLFAVDHPQEIEIFPNERLVSRPPFPDFTVFTASAPGKVLSARDHHGRDWTAALVEQDRRYVEGFQLLPFKGYAENHELTLNLGDLRGAKRAILLLDGWIDYASSSSNFAAHQAGLKLAPPNLQGEDSSGEWKTILEDMGSPAGLPKTIVVDLTGKVPLTRETRVRIQTNMRVYWDRIRIETGPQDSRMRIVGARPMGSRTSWVGYPVQTSSDGRAPFSYDYGRRDAFAPWKTHAGQYTPLGDVRELLECIDDRYVVLAHGEAITAEFSSAGLPALPLGWIRDWLLFVDGFGKDMDFHSAHPDAVGPYPRHRNLPRQNPRWIPTPDPIWESFRERYLVRTPGAW